MKEIFVVMSVPGYEMDSYPIAAYSDRETAQKATKWLGDDVEKIPFNQFADEIEQGLVPYEIRRDSNGLYVHRIVNLERAAEPSQSGIAIIWAHHEDEAAQTFLRHQGRT